MSQKFLIAKNRAEAAFFTRSSAYDRAQWVAEGDASVYVTADLADRAVRNLYKYGHYEARVVPLKEQIELEMPDETPSDAPPAEDTADTEMVAKEQGAAPEDEANVHGIEQDDDETDDLESELDAAAQMESETIPDRNVNNPAPSDDNKTTAVDLPAVKKIEYKSYAPPCPETDPVVQDAADEKVAVPANVKSELKAAADKFEKEGETTTNDERGSFCKTAAAAYRDLLAMLEKGTVEDLKKAQIFLTSWMNSLTTNMPPVTRDFVLSGGRKQVQSTSLKTLFDKAWDAKRAANLT